jgi:broad specificity phosphatase PhoE
VPVILLRHGETAWDLVNAHGWPGAANDLAPLTPSGVRQAEAAAELLAGQPVGTGAHLDGCGVAQWTLGLAPR